MRNMLQTELAAPNKRGFRIIYHADTANHCPGCGRSQWYVGRVSAECAFCATALPLQDISSGVALAAQTAWSDTPRMPRFARRPLSSAA